jgi:hypothetical protein
MVRSTTPVSMSLAGSRGSVHFLTRSLSSMPLGAARLMLAIAERLVADNNLEWAFCDTDSIAIARPTAMDEAEFHAKVDAIVSWFSALNPYNFGGSILKIEDVNFSLKNSKRHEPLFCWAISAKRYALFNLDSNGQPILRKASAHGLGHLRAPYDATNPTKNVPGPVIPLDEIGVEMWQHDLWRRIITAALAGHPDQVDLNYHPALNQPALSRYAATTPKLLRWFKGYNENHPYERQVKPLGFLYSLFAHPLSADDGEHILTGGPPVARRRAPDDCKPVAPCRADYSARRLYCVAKSSLVSASAKSVSCSPLSLRRKKPPNASSSSCP